MTNTPNVTLRDGSKMPALGLGTWKSSPGEVYEAVRIALEVGYRHIDCAAIYQNEAEVGRALREALAAGVVKREELWITSKLWNDSHFTEHVGPALEQTLRDLGLDYLDLYLIHWPIAFQHGVVFPTKPDQYATLEEVPLEKTWEAMLEQRTKGRAKNVGVSNMGPERIALCEGVGEAPSVDQVECHPHLQQRELAAVCRDEGIILTAYSPLGSPDRQTKKDDEPPLLEHPTIRAIADSHGKSTAQILIAWSIAQGFVVIPKSVNRGRLTQNLEAPGITLSEAELAAIAEMDRGYRYIDGSFFCRAGSPYQVEGIWR
jgi:alcohol dehydrogenase (NADP+)